jgi:hypothetical protein
VARSSALDNPCCNLDLYRDLLRISFLAAICDIPDKVCLLKYFMMDTFALSIFYYLKAIGNNDFVGGKMPLPATPPFFLLVFILILYPISNRPNVGIKPVQHKLRIIIFP